MCYPIFRRLPNPGCLATRRHRGTACSCPLVASTPEQFAAYIKEQRIKYDKLIKQIGLKGE